MADVGSVWGSDNKLGAEGAAAVAGALSKLVNLTSLDLGGTWNVEWVVSCVYVVCCVCVGFGCRLAVPCVYVVLCRVWCLSLHTGCGLCWGRMGIRQWAGCEGSSGSGGCAEQAGELDESVLGRYVECGVGGVVWVCRMLRVCGFWLSW